MGPVEIIHPGYVEGSRRFRRRIAGEMQRLLDQVQRLERSQRRPRILAAIVLTLGVASHVVMFGYMAHLQEQSRGRELALRARLAGLEVLTLEDATPVAYRADAVSAVTPVLPQQIGSRQGQPSKVAHRGEFSRHNP